MGGELCVDGGLRSSRKKFLSTNDEIQRRRRTFLGKHQTQETASRKFDSILNSGRIFVTSRWTFASPLAFQVPNSRGHDYGWRLQSHLGQEIQNLQTRFDDQHKKRLSTVILGYD